MVTVDWHRVAFIAYVVHAKSAKFSCIVQNVYSFLLMSFYHL